MASNFVPLQPVGFSPAKPAAPSPGSKTPAPSKDRSASAAQPAAAVPANFTALCSATAGSGASAQQPVITLRKEGDRVVQIRVQCVCGQVIELACDY